MISGEKSGSGGTAHAKDNVRGRRPDCHLFRARYRARRFPNRLAVLSPELLPICFRFTDRRPHFIVSHVTSSVILLSEQFLQVYYSLEIIVSLIKNSPS